MFGFLLLIYKNSYANTRIRTNYANKMEKTLKTILMEEAGEKVVWNENFGVYAVNLDSPKKAEEIKNLPKIKELFGTKIVEKSGRFFLNFHLSKKALEKGIKMALKDKFDFAPKKNKVQVEFISANPTGELHIGHGRDAFYGDALSNILEMAGNDVKREFYVNDAKGSTQIKELGKTVLGRGETYLTDSLKLKIKNLKLKIEEESEAGYLMAESIQKDNKKFIEEKLKIRFDRWFSEEEELYEKDEVEKILEFLKDKDLSYEKEGAVWFKTSEYGDDEDRVLVRSDGTPSYFLVDIAYHVNKFEKRKYDKVIDIWGADHQGHVRRMMAVKKALGWKGKLEILVGQLVALKEGGVRKRLSKRKGDVVWVKDLVEDVGLDAARWFFLEKGISVHTEFDLDLAKEQSKKNPVYYVQYSHARMCSILDKAQITKHKFQTNFKAQITNSKFERNLILNLVRFPEIVEDISKDYQVHHLATYIYGLAKTFTDFYENVRVLEAETEELKKARIELVFSAKQILGKALSLLGISAPTSM